MDDVYARYRESLKLGHQEAAEGRYAQAAPAALLLVAVSAVALTVLRNERTIP